MKTKHLLSIPKSYSKKRKKELLKEYRKPPMPKPKLGDSKQDKIQKQHRKDKQKNYCTE